MENDFDMVFIIVDTLYYYLDKYLLNFEKSHKKKRCKIILNKLYTIYEEEDTLLDNIVDDFLLI
jgi:hypothetical protein